MAKRICVNCDKAMTLDDIQEADFCGYRVCQNCADNIMNHHHYMRSGDYISWPNPAHIVEPVKARIPVSTRWRIWKRDDYMCVHCGKESDLSIDHIVAESLGGDMSDENLQTLCRSCNSRKGAKTSIGQQQAVAG